MTPKQIVDFLDEYIIGQSEAKKAIAIALRNRYRRMKLPKEIQEEITPKNILMIGSTGVGKTEIARRMAKVMHLPFVKVEASKYTEVGFVGRDVESMVRDLVNASVALVQKEYQSKNEQKIADYIVDKITRSLLPPLPSSVSEDKKREYEISFAKMRQKVIKGENDHLKIDIEITKRGELNDLENGMPPDIIKVQESIIKVLNRNESIKKTLTIKEAKEALKAEAEENSLDMEAIKQEGLKRAESSGVIFIDEIDKIATSSKDSKTDPSKEGVQRDLLPIIEGSNVGTKFGNIKTDYILFVAAGAFHLSKPSDLIPELQGRFPIRVELDALNEEAMLKILTQPKNSLITQYQHLLSVEGVELEFDKQALQALAHFAYLANQKTEDIGARRLHTVLERVLEDISFSADEYAKENPKVKISKTLIEQKLSNLVENADMSRYIL
ncbi:HslU--HslV peptidase ATPase subunit [Helicobacter sp. MIT 01-3238]|uniref:HslU--HslV peptidase ATPase subunit n=1 Tax=Helicobacter sp. MIT 01-3238 TaxID=398627 RepID=UPI000E1FB453|nr:HslU--HslV peptidase ATPase subunit [Helicobacter sp. MIT 01-3238]RDU54330.1 HslU--HslV peptidase ATPase subunit [Helicobacter sp. MIT 01-3238]